MSLEIIELGLIAVQNDFQIFEPDHIAVLNNFQIFRAWPYCGANRLGLISVHQCTSSTTLNSKNTKKVKYSSFLDFEKMKITSSGQFLIIFFAVRKNISTHST